MKGARFRPALALANAGFFEAPAPAGSAGHRKERRSRGASPGRERPTRATLVGPRIGTSLTDRPVRSRAGTVNQGGRAVSVATVTEISATSTQSFEDAIRQGLERATKTLRNVTAAWVKDQRVELEGGKIEHYLVHLEVTYVLEG